MALTGDKLSNAMAIATKYIFDNIPVTFSMTNPLYNEMMKRKTKADGTRLQIPLNFKKMSNVASITGTSSDTIDVGVQQNLTYGELDWKFIVEGFSVDLKELAQASGENAVVDIITAKAQNTLETMADLVSTQLYGSATSDAKALNGFGDIFAPSGTAYAGIVDTDIGNDSVGDPMWLPLLDTTTTEISYASISPKITKLKAKNKKAADLMLSNSAVFSAFKASQQAQQRFVQTDKLEAGFTGLMVDGAFWYADEYAKANNLYIITTSTMGIKYKYGLGAGSPLDVKTLKLPTAPVNSHQKYHVFNIYCNNRRLNANMSKLGAAQST